MNATTPRIGLFTRRPLARLDRFSLAALLVSAFWCGLFALFPGARGGPLPYLAVGLLVSAGLVAYGMRWAPILGAVLSGVVLVTMFTLTGYTMYHLTQPQAQFPIFVIVLLFVASLVAACGITVYTSVSHYSAARQATPHWLLPAFTGLAGIVIGAVLIAGIARPAVAPTSGEPVAHLGAASFTPTLVAVPRGSKLLIVDDGSILHILANGSWAGNRAAAVLEPGAPRINDVHIAGGSIEIGPFTTPGTYHILCLVHPGMELTILVP
jgi:plastocyanin